jgi:hypothetical protein
MSDSLSIPYLALEDLKAVVELRDERDAQDEVLSLFPRALHVGESITVRTLKRVAQAVRQTTIGGKGYFVQPGTLDEVNYQPGVVKPMAQITARDIAAFRTAADAVGQNDARAVAARKQADRVIARLMGELMDDIRIWRKQACVGALLGSFVAKIGEVNKTVDYGLTAIVSPGTTWTAAGATITADLRVAMNTFKQVNGLAADVIFYNPKITSDFLTNTAMLAQMAKSEFYSRAILELKNESATGGPYGDMMGTGEGVTWMPIDSVAAPIGGGTVADIWPRTTLVLANRAAMGGEWSMLLDPVNGVTSESPNVEVYEPPRGADVKNPHVLVVDNGIATFERPDKVMPFVVEFSG